MKLIFENWRKYLNEELLNEVSFEDVKQRFNSKKFRRAVERLDDQNRFVRLAKLRGVRGPGEIILKYIPNDIPEKDKAEALNWLISIFIKSPDNLIIPLWWAIPGERTPHGIIISSSEQTRNYLETFFQIKEQNLTRFLEIKSLSSIGSVQELEKIVRPARKLYQKHLEKKAYLDADQGKLKIFENNEFVVFIPTNKGAACELGKGTDWCTAAPGLNYYEQYHKEDDPLIIFKSKTDPKKDVQMHFGTDQFMDSKDYPIEEGEAIRLVSLLKNNEYLPKKILNRIKDVGTTDLGGGRKLVGDLGGTKEWYLNNQLHREDGPAIERPSGTKEWWLNGQLHREGGPAVEYSNGTKRWYLNGQRHREGGPAIEWPNGTKQWYLNGQRHREGGPAVEHPNGSKEWYLNGKRHREGGPAVEHPNGSKKWYLNGQPHREDGPAYEHPASGTKQWWLNGKRLTKRKWLETLESMKK